MALGGCVAEWAYLVRVHFSGHSPELRWNMMRVILGAMQVHFAFVGGEDDDNGFKCITEVEWDRIARYGFLTHEEIRQVATCSNGSRFFLPVTWALKEVRTILLHKQALPGARRRRTSADSPTHYQVHELDETSAPNDAIAPPALAPAVENAGSKDAGAEHDDNVAATAGPSAVERAEHDYDQSLLRDPGLCSAYQAFELCGLTFRRRCRCIG